MTGQTKIAPLLAELQESAPAGFALAFHIRFTTPTFLFQTYADDWISYYSENGLVMSDPTVLWGFQNEGTCRWSDLEHLDPVGVLKKSREYGLNYGLTCAMEVNGSRSIGSFARSDREFSDAEGARTTEIVAELQDLSADMKSFSVETTNQLNKMGVRISQAPG